MSDEDWRAGITVHPAADLFPLLVGRELEELAADIRENGQRDPIILIGDAILDGRNRYRACRQAEVEPGYESYDGDDPWGFVISRNLHRRHLTDKQRAMIGAEIAERQRGWNQYDGSPAGEPSPPSQAQARELLDVSKGSLGRARAVRTHGTAALASIVKDGPVPLAVGARVASECSVAEQDAFVAGVAAGRSPAKLAPPPPRDPRSPRPQEEDRPMDATVTELRPEPSDPEGIPPRQARRGGMSKAEKQARDRWLQRDALYKIGDTLDAIGIVLDQSEGLDPQITAGEAAQWTDSLTQKSRRIKELLKLLKERSS